MIGHELTHVRSRDILVLTLASDFLQLPGILLSLVFLADSKVEVETVAVQLQS